MHQLHRATLQEIGIICWYLCIAIVMTWPLVFSLSTHIIGTPTSDAPLFLWNAWELQRQFNEGELSMTTRSIIFPHASSLWFHTYTPIFSAIVLCYGFVTSNLVLAFNLVFLTITVASAYCMYRLLFMLMHGRLAAIFGGQLFGFQALWSIYVGFGTMNMLMLLWIPLAALLVEYYLRKQRQGYAVLAGGVTGLALVNDPYQGAFCITVVIVYFLLRKMYVEQQSSTFYGAGLYFLGFLFVAGPYLFMIFNQIEGQGFLLPTIEDVQHYSADPINFFRPYQDHPLVGRWSALFTSRAIINGNAFLGLTSVLFGLLCIWNWHELRESMNTAHRNQLLFWGIGVCFFIVIAIGPFIQFAGIETRIPSLYWFVSKIFPQVYILRVPMRWLLPAGFFIAGFVSLLLTLLFERMKFQLTSTVFFLLLSASFLFDQAFVPRTLLPVYVSQNQIISEIRNYQTTGSILELPASVDSGYWSVGDVQNHQAMLHQVLHQQPIITGHMSRLPGVYETEYRNAPVVGYLLQFQSHDPLIQDFDAQNIHRWLEDAELQTIIIRKKEVSPQKQIEVEYYIEHFLGFQRNSENDWYVVYTLSMNSVK